MNKPILLAILDGYGLRDEEHGNAVKLADNKVFNMLFDWNILKGCLKNGE